MTQDGWISVKERLPEDDDTVFLVHSTDGWTPFHDGIELAWFRLEDHGFYRSCCVGSRVPVSHWMPLPGPPQFDESGRRKPQCPAADKSYHSDPMPFDVKPGDKVRWRCGKGYVDCIFIGRDGDYVSLITPGSGFRVRMIHEVGPIPAQFDEADHPDPEKEQS